MASSTFEVGNAVFGIRTTSEEFGAWMDKALAPYKSDEEIAPYFSVVVPTPEPDKPRSVKEFNVMYRGSGEVVRTLHLPTLVQMLVAEIESFLYAERDDAIYAAIVPVSSNGATAIVPESLVTTLGGLGRKVRRAGLSLPAALAVAVDPDSGQISPVPSLLELPSRALEELGEFAPSNGSPDRTILDGPISPSVALMTAGAGGQMALQPISRAQALQILTTSVLNLEKLGGAALEGLAHIVREVPTYSIGGSVEEILDSFKKALRTG